MLHLTELITDQVKTVAVMFCAGVLVESLSRLKKALQLKTEARPLRALEEAGFWTAAAAVLSSFLYYCAFGRISFHAAVGFLTGLLLWKKICYNIVKFNAKQREKNGIIKNEQKKTKQRI